MKYIIEINDTPDSILNEKKMYRCKETGTLFSEEQINKMTPVTFFTAQLSKAIDELQDVTKNIKITDYYMR